MRRGNLLIGLCLFALPNLGCVTFQPTTTYPVVGRAYFIRQQVGTSVWVCDASTGSPACYEATNPPVDPAQRRSDAYAQVH